MRTRSWNGFLALSLTAGSLAAQSPTPPPGRAVMFVPGSRTIFDLNLAGEALGSSPQSVKLLRGNLEVVQRNGAPMVKTSSETEFLITLPEVLPANFTLEFALVPKNCSCAELDLSFEGTRWINQDVASAHIQWSTQRLGMLGGGDTYDTPMPDDLSTALPGVLTKVGVSFEGSTVKLYTNDRRLYTLDRQFARGRVLRVYLGGTDEPKGEVFLAGLRIASNSPALRFATTNGGFVAGQRTLFDLNAPPPPPPPPGQPPKPRPGIRVVQGAWSPVQFDGMRMFKASKPTELVVSLLEPLPRDFTVEFELVPKEQGNPQDLSFEGTATINQGASSAHLLWQAGGAMQVIGGSPDGYDTPMPDDFKVILPGVPTEVSASFEGNTVKLYTNGRRLYTLNRVFARGKVLRVFLGANNDADQAVYLAKLRIATNSPAPAGVSP